MSAFSKWYEHDSPQQPISKQRLAEEAWSAGVQALVDVLSPLGPYVHIQTLQDQAAFLMPNVTITEIDPKDVQGALKAARFRLKDDKINNVENLRMIIGHLLDVVTVLAKDK